MPFIVLRARVPRKLQLLDFFFSTNFVGPNRLRFYYSTGVFVLVPVLPAHCCESACVQQAI